MLRLIFLGLMATMALASPIYDRLSINGPLLQGTFKIGSGDNGLNSVMDQYIVSSYEIFN